MKSVFLPPHVKKALANTKKDGPAFDIIKRACKELKLQYECPGIVGKDVVVHFTINRHKIAILFESTGPWNRRKAEVIRHEGWVPSIVNQYQIITMGYESIKNQLEEMIKERKNAIK